MTLYFKCENVVCYGDDLGYRYVLGERAIGTEAPEYYNDDNLVTFATLPLSLKNHYLYTNGRLVVHGIEQIIVGPLDYKIKSLSLTVFLICAIIFIGRYVSMSSIRWSALLYALVTLALLYTIPVDFFWLSFGMNYLFVIGVLTLWLLLERRTNKPGVAACFVLVLFSFLTGWTHEGFILPLCGATFIKALFNLKQMRRRQWVMYIPLWIGCIVMVIAPGNFVRMGQAPIIGRFFNGIFLIGSQWCFWIYVVGLVILYLHYRSRFKEAIGKYSIVLLALILSIMMDLVVNTGPWSVAPMIFYLMLFSLSCLTYCLPISWENKRLNVCGGVLLLLILVHQCFIAYYQKVSYDNFDAALERYKTSPQGYMAITPAAIPDAVAPWVSDVLKSGYFATRDLTRFAAPVISSTPDKECISLGVNEYKVTTNPEEFFNYKYRLPGSAGVYEGEIYFWCKESIVNNSEGITFHYGPIHTSDCPDLVLKIKSIIDNQSLSRTETITPSNFRKLPGIDSMVVMEKLPSIIWHNIDSVSVK